MLVEETDGADALMPLNQDQDSRSGLIRGPF